MQIGVVTWNWFSFLIEILKLSLTFCSIILQRRYSHSDISHILWNCIIKSEPWSSKALTTQLRSSSGADTHRLKRSTLFIPNPEKYKRKKKEEYPQKKREVYDRRKEIFGRKRKKSQLQVYRHRKSSTLNAWTANCARFSEQWCSPIGGGGITWFESWQTVSSRPSGIVC